jgi:hypothetical protein
MATRAGHDADSPIAETISPTILSEGAAAHEANGAAFLSRDDILGLKDREYRTLTVKAWGGKAVRIQSLTASERDAFEDSIQKQQRDGSTKQNLANVRARLCVLTLVDANGQRLFAEEHARTLGQRNASAINEIFEASAKLSGILKSDLEELVGNSNGTDTGAS